MAPTKAVMPVLLKLWASAANAAKAHIDQNVPNIPTKPDSCKDRNINTTCNILTSAKTKFIHITNLNIVKKLPFPEKNLPIIVIKKEKK